MTVCLCYVYECSFEWDSMGAICRVTVYVCLYARVA
jgi:hypothetical protein